MMNRGQDTVIDDDEETCPLCIEEFDLSDKNFRPCPCGYQICQFCFNSLKNTYERSTCPNCRRPYDEKTIQYKIPTAEEFKLDQLNKNKKQAAAKRKETEKREVETSSRRNLAGVRVKQQNLVYVIGLIPSIKDEQALLQTLRGPEYFGQYGEIDKIVVSKAKPGAANQGIGVYVTYARKEDAALCINSVDGSLNGDRVLRAQFGTTKYCSAYLRGEVCNNKSCSFLHETGEDGQSTSLQNEPHGARLPVKSTFPTNSAPISIPPRPLSATHSAQPMARSGSKDDDAVRKDSNDGSALPLTASWANANAPVARARRASQANSRATPSPSLTHASLAASKPEDPKPKDVPAPQPSIQPSSTSQSSAPQPPSTTNSKKPVSIPEAVQKIPVKLYDPIQAQYDFVLQTLSRNIPFVYDDSCLTPEQRAQVDLMPQFIDPYGGAKRRAMREREEADRAKLEVEAKAKLEAQAIASAEETLEDDDMAAGSLALGGEPEDDPRSLSSRSAIGRPTQAIADQFTNITSNARSLTPQQRQALSQQSSARNTAFEMSDFDRREPQYSQAQFEQISSHQRHGSRYFNNDTKSSSTSRFSNQQAGFYTSAVQGPPPGLPTAGTPPVSGGGMFAHGQNFTNPGFGTSKDVSADAYSRTRSGTNQGHDTSKREFLLSLQNNPLRSPPLPASAPGGLNTLYGQLQGAYQDPGLVKQRKKGKKHRHANTSSSGGVEHLADPSIVQSRHQGNTAGQGLFGGNQVDERNFPPLPIRSETQNSAFHSRVSSFHSLNSSGLRSSTPKIPPGFELSHAHPVLPSSRVASPAKSLALGQRSVSTASATVAPAVPLLPTLNRTSTPKPKTSDPPKDTPASTAHENTPQTQDPKVLRSDSVEISLGSPKPRVQKLKSPEVVAIKESTNPVESLESGVAPTTPSVSAQGRSSSKPQLKKPEKIEIPSSAPPVAAQDILKATSSGTEAISTPILDTALVETPKTQDSLPGTPPATTPSAASKASMNRPRTLRLTTGMIAKAAAEAAPSSATTDKSSILPSITGTKKGSRRPSIVSSAQQSRPSTPALSEQPSHDVSRAGSPPPSIVGSAPDRGKTKNQLKKERREKAKKTTETSEPVAAAPVQPAVETVAPVIARQKKQKRRADGGAAVINTDDSATMASKATREEPRAAPIPMSNQSKELERDASPKKSKVNEKDKPAQVKASKSASSQQESTSLPPAVPKEVLVSPKEEENPKLPYTLRDLYVDADGLAGPDGTASRTTIQKLLNSHVSPMSKILNSMIQSGDLAKDHPWLNPTSFNSPAYKLQPDTRRGQDYLDGNGYSASDAFGYVYLPMKEKQALKDGHAVSVADVGDKKEDLLKKCLVTSSGWVLRHLSGDESEKLLELDERRHMYLEEFGEIGTMEGLGALELDDYSNLAGGMDHLSRYGERHGVVWVVGEGEHEDDLVEDDDDEFEIFDDEEEGLNGGLAHSEGEDFEEEIDRRDTSFDESGLNMPGAWDMPPPMPASQHRLPGLVPHSKSSAFARGRPPTNANRGTLQQHGNGHDQPSASGKLHEQSSADTTSQAASNPRSYTHPINLRALEGDLLTRRVAEKQKELEAARKEMEKAEKLWNKKSKDIGRWREGLVKG